MKTTHPNIPKPERGSTLLVTIIVSALVGTVLCSYLVLITNRNTAAMRATAWNSAIPLLEAGIEEALTHLRDDSNRPTANLWNKDLVNGQTVYWKRRDFSDQSYYYVTNVNITSPSPQIWSAGYVPSPLKKDEYISRLVVVTATNPPSIFSKAIAADGLIKLSGNAIVDGFNSDGFASAIDAYSFPTNRNANGSIATNSKQLKAIDVGTGHVYGRAITGPGGTVSTAGGAVGDFDWNQKSIGIEPDWDQHDMNVFFQPNSPPGQVPSGALEAPVTVGVSNIIYLYQPRKKYVYKTDTLTIGDQLKPIYVRGNCTLWVNNLYINGTGYIYIEPGASLQLFVGGTASLSGGGVVNATGLPQSFSYFGSPSNKTLNYSGAANFIGTINAPQATVILSGISPNAASLYGAVICSTFSCSGGSSVHYDQSLKGGSIFLISSWREQ